MFNLSKIKDAFCFWIKKLVNDKFLFVFILKIISFLPILFTYIQFLKNLFKNI